MAIVLLLILALVIYVLCEACDRKPSREESDEDNRHIIINNYNGIDSSYRNREKYEDDDYIYINQDNSKYCGHCNKKKRHRK